MNKFLLFPQNVPYMAQYSNMHSEDSINISIKNPYKENKNKAVNKNLETVKARDLKANINTIQRQSRMK